MKKQFKNLITSVAVCFALSLFAGAAQAATISVNPADQTVAIGDVFQITIDGSDFTDGTIGGGFSLSWDSAVLDYQSSSITFAGDQTFGQSGDFSVVGSWINADVTGLNGPAGPGFEVATITFLAVGLGTSALDLEIGTFAGGSDRIWADGTGFIDLNPSFADGSVTVNDVPLPAAAWLFGSGLLGLAGVARRRKAAAR